MDTKKLRQKILDLAIRGKLVPQDPNDEPASVLLERIKAEKEKLIKEGKIKKSKQSASVDSSPYEKLPKGWVKCLLGEIVDVRDGTHNSPNFHSTGYPLITSKNLCNGKIDMTNVKLISEQDFVNINKRSKVDVGDILFAMIGTIGNPVLIQKEPNFAIKNVALFKNFSKSLSSKYILYYLCASEPYLNEIAAGGLQHFIPLNVFREKLPIFLPPYKEQHRIIAEVERLFALIDNIEEGKASLEEAIKQAKRKVLELAVTGKLCNDNRHYEKYANTNKNFCNIFVPISTKNHQIKQSEICETGNYPVITQSMNFIEGYSNHSNKLLLLHNTPVIIFGDHTRVVKYVDFDFIVGADGVKVLKTTIYPKFAYYSLLHRSYSIRDRGYSRHYRYLQEEPLFVPSIKEQINIVKKIEDIFGQLDTISQNLV